MLGSLLHPLCNPSGGHQLFGILDSHIYIYIYIYIHTHTYIYMYICIYGPEMHQNAELLSLGAGQVGAATKEQLAATAQQSVGSCPQ